MNILNLVILDFVLIMGNIAYVKIFLDWIEATEKLKDAEKGRLIDALVAYAKGDEDVNDHLKGNEAYLFPIFRLMIDRDIETRSQLGENGSKGGAPVGNRNAKKQPKTTKNKQKQAEKEKEEEKDKDNDNDNSIIDSYESMCFAPVISAWNSLPDPITKVYKIKPGSTRETMLKVRIRDFSLDSVLQAIENIQNSAFCRGVNNRGWVISFDWFLKPNNFQKVLEGNYNDRETKRTDNDRVRDELAEWMEEVKI